MSDFLLTDANVKYNLWTGHCNIYIPCGDPAHSGPEKAVWIKEVLTHLSMFPKYTIIKCNWNKKSGDYSI